jgi:uncharacterized protein YxjI
VSELTPPTSSALAGGPWSGSRYSIVRPLWSLLGRTYRVYNELGHLVLFVRHPLFKFRPEFTLFADEAQRVPLLTVRSRRVIAISMEHDVTDAETGRHLASVRNQGLSFLVRDAWHILDDQDRVAGEMIEEGPYLLRRLMKFLPGRHSISIGGTTVGHLVQRFRFFTKVFDLELIGPPKIDTRFLLATAILAIQADVRREQS